VKFFKFNYLFASFVEIFVAFCSTLVLINIVIFIIVTNAELLIKTICKEHVIMAKTIFNIYLLRHSLPLVVAEAKAAKMLMEKIYFDLFFSENKEE
jgi:hypothetical protein